MKKQSWLSRLLGQSSNTPSSAEIAKDRLTVLVASNNQLRSRLTSERIEQMKREIADVVGKYVSGVDINAVNINHRKEESMDVLEMNISLPEKR